MTFRPIPSPLTGEHVLAVVPRPAYPSVDASWRRRTRMFTGRALDADSLEREQDARAGGLALLGQTLAPGVVLGLDTVLEPPPGGGANGFLRVSPGLGITASGEDVMLGRELRIALDDLLPEAPLPRAAILTMVPVVRWVRGRFDPDDHCQRDESEDAFADERRVDGIELELVPWSDEWRVLDDATATRNALSYIVFALEAMLGAGDVAPWQRRGLPIALLGLTGGGVAWIDRHAVVRAGGHAPSRTPLVAGAGARPLWQARILQLAAHIDDERGTGALPNATALGLGLMPPAGVVPRDALEVAPLTNRFFPPIWRLRAAPIPREQLDGVLARAASLAPLATAIGEEVLVLVPVPQAVYEPKLLVHDERPDPLFQQEIDRLVAERTDWLGRRLYLRSRRDAVLAAIDHRLVVADPDPDPERLEDEGDIQPVSTGEDTYGIVDDGVTPRPQIVIELRKLLDKPLPGTSKPLLTDAERALLYDQGIVPLIEAVEAKLKRADDTIDFGFLKTQTDIYRLRQYVLGNTLGTRLATSPALATIAKGETSGAVRDDLSKLFTVLSGPPPSTTIQPPGGGTPPPPPPRDSTRSGLRFVGTGTPERFAARSGTERPAVTEALAGVTTTAPQLELELTASGFRTLDAALLGTNVLGSVVTSGGSTIGSILESGAVIGDDYRTVTLAERLAPAAATEVRSAAKATNYENAKTLLGLKDLGLNVDDLPVNGFVKGDDRTSRPLGELTPDSLRDLLQDPDTSGSVDEGMFFHDATRVLEGHIATLRNLEARVAQYRELLRECKTRLATLRRVETTIAHRLDEVGHELTEARHGVATARTLLAEELARLARIIARRKAVLAQHVDVLAYVRPRYADGLVEVPSVSLDPGLLDSPLPACLTGHDDAPTELDELVALLREAPLSWFRHAGVVLDHLNRVELLHRLVLTSRTRVQVMQQVGFTAPWTVQQPAGRFGKALATVGRAQIDAIWEPRSAVAQLDLRKFIDLSWLESREAARHVVSLGDVIEGNHGRSAAAAAALAELERINKVSACLWARVGEVLPVIRLAWAETLGQYEPGRSLRTLSALPRWRDVDLRLRHDIEVLAEWLMDRVDPAQPAALAWMLDLVRTAILLASHAPVDEIIAGHVPTPVPASPGALVPVVIDPARVKIGMHVTFFHAGAAVARGIVEDLVGQRAQTRIAEAVTHDLRLDIGVQAHFTTQLRALGVR